MKIALPSRNNEIDSHFGHCEHFTIYTIEDNTITDTELFTPPPGCGCKSGVGPMLKERGVNILLGGNMGQGAVNVLATNEIKVFRGCAGPIEQVAADFLAGKIKDAPIICNDHECSEH